MIPRRHFIALLGGAAAAWPMVARGQQPERMRRIGILNTVPAEDPHGQERIGAFLQALQQAGWTIGVNVQIDQRWSAGGGDTLRKGAMELVALGPDVIFATGGVAVSPLLQASRTMPIVFASTPDPVGAGFVESLARPGGQVTGFTTFEYSMSVKWLELLKLVAPEVTRVAVLRDPSQPSGIGQFGAIQGAASTFGVELVPLGVRDAAEIDRGVMTFARSPNGGLIVTTGQLTVIHRRPITAVAARAKLPAVLPSREFVTAGGLMSYGPDRIDPYRRAAEYINRILKGEKPVDLPVQAPTKFQLIINLKAAKTLGLTIPTSLLARADEVIE
jgi:putative tryptophan/tyrosine transport system substrate-binding protein